MILLKYLPFTLHWITSSLIGKDTKTFLDLGCGDGQFTKAISYGENWKIIGCELYDDSITQARRSNIYTDVIKADVTNLPKSIANKKYDVVLSIQVIEHLKKQVGIEALNKWEKLARKKVIISTPVGFIDFDRVEIKVKEKNLLQKHLSGWTPEEFTKRGYKVYGQGLKFIYGEGGLIRKSPIILWPLLILFSYLLAPLVFFYPSLGTYMVAIKNIGLE